uniref:Uncharacterized protein n=1 Tax=Anguilla anguilla TaxID=7936 RepID=A0A0E9XMQ0_ANGAN
MNCQMSTVTNQFGNVSNQPHLWGGGERRGKKKTQPAFIRFQKLEIESSHHCRFIFKA